MNDAPPPLIPASSQPPYQQPHYQEPPKTSGSGKKWLLGCGCGCLGLLVLIAVGGYFGMNFLKSATENLVAGYTSSEPVKVVVPPLSEAKIQEATEKFDAFKTGMSEGAEPVPLVLTSDDINALILNHPSFSSLAERASVSVEGDKLRSQVSLNLDELEIPVKFIAEAVKGKYFNGEATFSLGMAAGRPALYIEGLEVNGAPIPDEFMTEFRKKNFFEEVSKDPDAAAFFEKIEDLRIENGELIIVPKATSN